MARLLSAQTPPPIGMVECYLQPDLTRPSARSTPGLTGGPGSGQWSGQLKLHNNSNQQLFIDSAIIHVLDGYGKPLFDIDAKHSGIILCRKDLTFPIRAEYFGGVSSFKFTCDLTVKGPDGQVQVYKQLSQPESSGKKNQRIPGY